MTEKNESTSSIQKDPSNCPVAEVSRGVQMGGISTQVRCLGRADGRELVRTGENGDDFWLAIIGEEVCKGCGMPELFKAYNDVVAGQHRSEIFVGFPIHRNTSR